MDGGAKKAGVWSDVCRYGLFSSPHYDLVVGVEIEPVDLFGDLLSR
jgi:hypothetical protein